MDGKEAADTEFYQRHLNEAAAMLATVWKQREDRLLRAFPKNVESPLEAAFLAWWSMATTAGLISEIRTELMCQHDVTVSGQRFRLDFAVMPRSRVVQALEKFDVPLRAVAVELDGHDFHERTKDQVTYRNQRDRVLSDAGWDVLHFSGSEFNSRPGECVLQAAQRGARISLDIEQAIIDKGGYEDIYQL